MLDPASSADSALATELAASRARVAELELQAAARAATVAEAAAAEALLAAAAPLEPVIASPAETFPENLSAVSVEPPATKSVASVSAAAPEPSPAPIPLSDTGVGAASGPVAGSSSIEESPVSDSSVSPSPISASISTVASSEALQTADLLTGFSFDEPADVTAAAPGHTGDTSDIAGIAAMVAQHASQNRAETGELLRQLAAELAAQRAADNEMAAEIRRQDQAALQQLILSTQAPPAAPAPAPAVAPPDRSDRRATTFSSVVGSGADAQVSTVSAVLPRNLTDPDLNSLPTYDGDSGSSSAFKRSFGQLIGYVPVAAQGIYLRACLRGSLRDKVESDLEASGVRPATAVDLATLWDLIDHHSSNPSDAADAVGRAASLAQPSPSQFSPYYAKLTQHWLDAGIYLGRDSISAEDWTTIRIGLLATGVHTSVMRELLRDPAIFKGSYDDFRRSCEAISASLGHQSGRRAGGVAMMGGDSAPAADSDEYLGWVASMQGGGSGLPRDDVFKFPWDNVAAWCSRFPPRADTPVGCAFCAKSKDSSCRATAPKHVAPMCANMYSRNVKKPMTDAIAQRVVTELRAAGYPVPC